MDVVEESGRRTEHPGGSAANVAVGLGRLGVRTELLTHLAEDDRSHRLVRHLEASDVLVLEPSFTADRASSAAATIEPSGAARYEFDVSWALPEPIPEVRARVLHLGALPAFRSPMGQLDELIARVGPREITFDPNIRPALIGEHAAVLPRFEEITERASVVKLSDEDAAWLYLGLAVEEVLDRLLALGVGLAIVTRGADGALLATPAHRLSVAAVPVRVVDTIGAGDTFMASTIRSIVEAGGSDLTAGRLRMLAEDATAAAAGDRVPSGRGSAVVRRTREVGRSRTASDESPRPVAALNRSRTGQSTAEVSSSYDRSLAVRRRGLPHSRRAELLTLIRSRGRLDVVGIPGLLGVSPRPYARPAHARGPGAGAARIRVAYPAESGTFESSLEVRNAINPEEKQRIANAVPARLGEAQTIFIDEGYQPQLVAQRLPLDRPLTVVTASLPVATLLAPRSNMQVIVLGGRVRGNTLGVADHWPVETLSRLTIDLAILGANGVTVERGMTTPDPAVAAVKAAAVRASKRRIFIGAHHKFGTATFVKFAEVTDFELIITGHELSASLANRFATAGAQLLRV